MTIQTPRAPGYEMSDEAAASLRAQVPDTPIRLAADHLACSCCGIAVPVAPKPEVPPLPLVPGDLGPLPDQQQYTRCGSCEAIHDAADEYVAAHPLIVRQVGERLARERVESVLIGLEVLGQRPPADLALLLARMHPASHGLRFQNPLALTDGLCSPHRFAHDTLSQRQRLRAAYAATLKDRLALHQPPVPIPCPSGGYALCGVASVDRSAVEVLRRGVPATAQVVWQPLTTTPQALGGRGPHVVRGHACPPCSNAIDAEYAVGPSARAHAVLAFLQRTSAKKRVARLSALLDDDFAPVLLGWAALPLPRTANREPWTHLQRVLDRL